MVAYYCFEDASNLGKDCSVNANHGTAEGTVTAVTGYKGMGAKFGGVDNPADIHVPNSPSLQFTSALSISYATKHSSLVSMRGDDHTSAQAVVAKSHDDTGFVAETLIYDNQSGINPVFANRNADAVGNGSNASFGNVWSDTNTDKWIHVVFTVDTVKRIAKTYHDGVLVQTVKIAMDFTNANTQDMYIGKYSDYWYPFNGVIDEVRLYNRVLTARDAKLLYLQGATVSGMVRDLGNYSVNCKNNNTGDSVNIAVSTATFYDCEAKGLKAKTGENVTITINGTKQ
jgi:hypothetical protein